MSPRDKDRRKISGRVIGAAAAGAGVLLISIGALISNIGSGSDTPSPGAGVVRLELIAARDVGALPASDSWCSGSDHCWIFQQSSGDATDYGSPGGWHLSPSGTPRAGTTTSLPVRDASGWVDYASEAGAWISDSNYYQSMSATFSATDVFSVTMAINTAPPASGSRFVLYHDSGSAGFRLYQTSGSWIMQVRGSGGVKTASFAHDRWAWQCLTFVYDGRTASAAKAYRNGETITMSTSDLSGAGSWAVTHNLRVGFGGGSGAVYGMARGRVDENSATTQAEHQALCGDLWQAPAGGRSDNKPYASDDTWTQTAGAGCYPTGDSTAVCVPGGLMPYHIVDSARGPAWPPQQALTNELLYSTAIDCTNWTCVGSATATFGAVAPDGSATATLLAVSVGANHVEQDLLAAFTVDASPLHLGLWFRCTTGTVHPHGSNDGTLGDWDIDCSCVAGAWTYLHADHACVTVNIPFNADSSGNGGLHFDGSSLVNGTVWAPTLTEQRAWSRVVIPTAAAGVALGNPIWAINNTSTSYYRAGDTVTQDLTEYDGTCFTVPGTDILLAGSPTCSGSWYGLKVQK